MMSATALGRKSIEWVRHGLSSTPVRVFLVTRLGLALFVFLGMAVFPMVSDNVWRGAPENLLVDGWARWDSGWYKHIAEDGYNNRPNDAGQRDTAFFPLYPLLVYGLGSPTGNFVLAGTIVSHLALLCALVLLHRLIDQRLSVGVADRTVILISTFPFAFFFGAMYTESLFLLCAVGAFAFGERDKWITAAAFAACAGATKTIGVALAPALFILYLSKREWRLANVRPGILWTLSPCVGLIAYIAFLKYKFDEPLAFMSAQDASGWSVNASGLDRLTYGLERLTSLSGVLAGDIMVPDVMNLVALAWALVCAVASWRVLGAAYAIWSLLVILPALGIWIGFGRYALPIFPLFVVTAVVLERPGTFQSVVFVSTLLLALLSTMFSHFYWVA